MATCCTGTRSTALPIRIGRGYDNDFILDDAHSAASHAIVEADGDGGLVLRDLGSKNGVIHRGQRQTSMALDGDTVVRLGHTQPARARRPTSRWRPNCVDTHQARLGRRAPATVGPGADRPCSAACATWLSDAEPFAADPLPAWCWPTALAAGLVWAGVWAVGQPPVRPPCAPRPPPVHHRLRAGGGHRVQDARRRCSPIRSRSSR